jgi:lipopolysaccharide/colanic/teichoic acid biosynthesis glycosyltransferase
MPRLAPHFALAGTVPAMSSPDPRPRPRADWAQRAFDLIVGSALLVVALPVIGLALLAVKLTSRGPGVYTQTRLGRFGRPFRIYKIRSMTHNCEKRSGIQWSTKGDARVTPVGRVLRKTHVDELPQLFNILKGEMSLVGPRPERPELVGVLEASLPRYRERLTVRPGLTGLAQVQLPPDTDLESVRRKLRYDLHYAAHGGVWTDLRLMIATAVHVAGLPFAVSRGLLGLPGEPEVEPERVARPVVPSASTTDTAVHPIHATHHEVSVDAARA